VFGEIQDVSVEPS
jgi:hypothetical protein